MFEFFKKKTLPNRLLVLAAIPTDRQSFLRIAKHGSSDFVRSLQLLYRNENLDALWKQYAKTAELTNQTFAEIEKRGGKVITNFCLDDIAQINQYDTVVLFAHHSNDSDQIEIGDGQMVRSETLVNTIPEGCRLILDMTSCYSSYLIPKIKARIPDSRIIGINVATSINLRLFLLTQIVDQLVHRKAANYFEAFQNVLTQLDLATNSVIKGAKVVDHTSAHLGSNLQSTVYAPREAKRGDDFLVSVFMHKNEDAEELEIMAKNIDENLEKRASKRISIKVKNGDKIEFQLAQTRQGASGFTIDKKTKSFFWGGGVNTVEFVVSVSHDCPLSKFVASIKISVNKLPVADLAFSTMIVQDKGTSQSCAEFSFTPYDRDKEKQAAKTSLINQLRKKQQEITQLATSGTLEAKREIEMCEKCIELLEKDGSKQHRDMLKVFISSTSDMKRYREIMKTRVEACEMFPDMYELWGQGNDYPRDLCCKHVLDSDIFVCILGENYGSIEPMWDRSMTEIEYRVALKAGKPILIFIDKKLDHTNKNEPIVSISERQMNFLAEVQTQRTVSFFENEISLSMVANSDLLTTKHGIES